MLFTKVLPANRIKAIYEACICGLVVRRTRRRASSEQTAPGPKRAGVQRLEIATGGAGVSGPLHSALYHPHHRSSASLDSISLLPHHRRPATSSSITLLHFTSFHFPHFPSHNVQHASRGRSRRRPLNPTPSPRARGLESSFPDTRVLLINSASRRDNQSQVDPDVDLIPYPSIEPLSWSYAHQSSNQQPSPSLFIRVVLLNAPLNGPFHRSFRSRPAVA